MYNFKSIMQVCLYARVCVCVCGCLCVYACAYARVFACAYVCAYAFAFIEVARQTDKPKERQKEGLNLILFWPAAFFRSSGVNSCQRNIVRPIARRRCVMIVKRNL